MKKRLITCGLLIILCQLIFIYSEKLQPEVVKESNLQLLQSTDIVGIYEMQEDSNMLFCDLTTVSYIVNNMIKDGYVYNILESTTDVLNFTLKNSDYTFRCNYTTDGKLLIICNKYEKSYVPITYINVSEEEKT